MDKEVILYKENEIEVLEPTVANESYFLYVRPNDNIKFGFDLSSVRVEVVRGDVHFVFENGSRINVVSLGALAFGEGAPKIHSLDGKNFTLDQILTKASALDYDEAVLILTNRDEINYSEDKPDVITTSTEQDSSLEAGNPIAGYGKSDTATTGVPSDSVFPGFSVTQADYSGTGSFVVTLNTSYSPFLLDNSNVLPGDIERENSPQVNTQVYYGATVSSVGDRDLTNVSGVTNTYNYWAFTNGIFGDMDPSSQLVPTTPGGGNQKLLIDSNASDGMMRYYTIADYSRGVIPNVIDIVMPASVAAEVFIESAVISFTVTNNTDGSISYRIGELDPIGQSPFYIVFPQNMPQTFFDLSYTVFYTDSQGEIVSINITHPIAITAVTSSSDLDITSGSVLSSTTNPIDAIGSSDADIIVGGGGSNIIDAREGDDNVFTYVGNDYVSLGAGNDILWGSLGQDFIKGDTLGGNNTLRFDNENLGLDDGGTYVKDEYYNTFTGTGGISAHFGVTETQVKSLANSESVVSGFFDGPEKSISGGDNLAFINHSSAGSFSVVLNIQNYILSSLNDTIIIYDSLSADKIIDGNEGTDTVRIHNELVGSIIDLQNLNITGFSSSRSISLSNFESFVGSDNDETFIAYYLPNTDATTIPQGIDYVINGGGGSLDTVTYENLANNIELYANTGTVYKYYTGDVLVGFDSISNIESFTSTVFEDTIYGAFNNNYMFINPNSAVLDNLSYDRVTNGVTYVVGGNTTNNNDMVYKTSVAYKISDLPVDTGFDEFNREDFNIVLSGNTDVAIANENISVDFNMGGGQDILSYQELKDGIILTSKDDATTTDRWGQVTIEKSGAAVPGVGDTDTFDISIGSGLINVYEVIGTESNDTFYLDKGKGAQIQFFDGAGGDNTLSYANASYVAADQGITININGGDNNFVLKANGGIDYIKNFLTIEGSQGQDEVIFGQSLTSIDSIKGNIVDLQGGVDTVNLASLPSTILGTDSNGILITNTSVMVSFDGDEIVIDFGYYNSSDIFVAKDVLDPTNFDQVRFINTEGVTGTSERDIFIAVSDRALSFNGAAGIDIIDYSNVVGDVIFDINAELVTKDDVDASNNIIGTYIDIIQSGEHFISGTGNTTFKSVYANSYFFDGSNVLSGKDAVLSYEDSRLAVIFDLANDRIIKGLNSMGDPLNVDTYLGVTGFVGSTLDDIFIIYEPTAGSGVQSFQVDGIGGTDVFDFSNYTNSWSGTWDTTGNSGSIVIGVGIDTITWNFSNIEGLILTNYDDTVNLVGNGNYYIDGGQGDDTVSYANDADIESIIFSFGNSSVITKQYTGGSSLDTLVRVENLILSSGNDNVAFQQSHGSNTIKNINAGDGIDLLNFGFITNDLTIDYGLTGFKISGLDVSSGEFTFGNFEQIRASQGINNITVSGIPQGSGGAGTSVDGLQITGNNTGETHIIFNPATVTTGIVLSLSNNIVGKDTLSGDITGEMVFSNITSFTLTSGNDRVNASENKNSSFDGGSGIDTLSYENFTVVVGGIIIDWSKAQVQKYGNSTIYDEFYNFENIIGTGFNDIFKITDITTAITGISIDLRGGDDILWLDLTEAVNVDLVSNSATSISGTLSFSGSGAILGATILKLSDNDDTLILESTASSTGFFQVFDGGSGQDTIDAANIVNLTFNSNTAQVSTSWNGAGPNIIYDGRTYNNFERVIGGSTMGYFFGGLNSYEYVGRSGAINTLNYANSAIGVTFDFANGEIIKGVGDSDKFSNIDIFIGSDSVDTFIFSSSLMTNTNYNLNSLYINAKPNASLATRDIVKFEANSSSALTTEGVSLTLSSHSTENFTSSFSWYQKSGALNYSTQFTGIKNFEFSDADDVITISDGVSDDLNFYLEGGHNNAFVNTINQDAVFNSLTGVLTTSISGTSYNYQFVKLSAIKFLGSADYEIYGSLVNYDYQGANPTSTNVILNYNTVSGGIEIDVEKGEVIKLASGEKDTFSNILYIIGTLGNDTVVLEANRTGATMTLDGSGGDDTISFENLTIQDFSVANFSNTAGYALINFETFGLNSLDNTFTGSITANYKIDGLDGTDILIYTAAGYDFEVNFIEGQVRKKSSTTGALIGIDTFFNFEGAITGAGNDIFIIGDNQAGADINGGAGQNILRMSNIISYDATYTYDNGLINVNYSDKTTSAISSSTYTNFREIDVVNGDVSFIYKYSTFDDTNPDPIQVKSLGGNDSTVLFNDTAGGNTFKVIFTTATAFSVERSSPTLNNPYYLNFENFNGIKIDPTTVNNILDVSLYGFNPISVQGGGSTNDKVSYELSSFARVVNITSIGTGQNLRATITSENNSGDSLENIENLSLTNSNDKVILQRSTAGSAITYITIDGLGGIDEVSLQGYIGGVTMTLSGSSFSVDGYILNNFETYTLTDHNDTINGAFDSTFTLNAGAGDSDTLSYASSGAQIDYLSIFASGDEFRVIKTNTTGTKLDIVSSFANITATAGDDSFIHNSSGYLEISKDMTINMGAGNDTVSFQSLLAATTASTMVLTALNNETHLTGVHLGQDTSGTTPTNHTLAFTHWENLILSDGEDNLELRAIGGLNSNISINAGVGNDSLTFSNQFNIDGQWDLSTGRYYNSSGNYVLTMYNFNTININIANVISLIEMTNVNVVGNTIGYNINSLSTAMSESDMTIINYNNSSFSQGITGLLDFNAAGGTVTTINKGTVTDTYKGNTYIQLTGNNDIFTVSGDIGNRGAARYIIDAQGGNDILDASGLTQGGLQIQTTNDYETRAYLFGIDTLEWRNFETFKFPALTSGFEARFHLLHALDIVVDNPPSFGSFGAFLDNRGGSGIGSVSSTTYGGNINIDLNTHTASGTLDGSTVFNISFGEASRFRLRWFEDVYVVSDEEAYKYIGIESDLMSAGVPNTTTTNYQALLDFNTNHINETTFEISLINPALMNVDNLFNVKTYVAGKTGDITYLGVTDINLSLLGRDVVKITKDRLINSNYIIDAKDATGVSDKLVYIMGNRDPSTYGNLVLSDEIRNTADTSMMRGFEEIEIDLSGTYDFYVYFTTIYGLNITHLTATNSGTRTGGNYIKMIESTNDFNSVYTAVVRLDLANTSTLDLGNGKVIEISGFTHYELSSSNDIVSVDFSSLSSSISIDAKGGTNNSLSILGANSNYELALSGTAQELRLTGSTSTSAELINFNTIIINSVATGYTNQINFTVGDISTQNTSWIIENTTSHKVGFYLTSTSASASNTWQGADSITISGGTIDIRNMKYVSGSTTSEHNFSLKNVNYIYLSNLSSLTKDSTNTLNGLEASSLDIEVTSIFGLNNSMHIVGGRYKENIDSINFSKISEQGGLNLIINYSDLGTRWQGTFNYSYARMLLKTNSGTSLFELEYIEKVNLTNFNDIVDYYGFGGSTVNMIDGGNASNEKRELHIDAKGGSDTLNFYRDANNTTNPFRLQVTSGGGAVKVEKGQLEDGSGNKTYDYFYNFANITTQDYNTVTIVFSAPKPDLTTSFSNYAMTSSSNYAMTSSSSTVEEQATTITAGGGDSQIYITSISKNAVTDLSNSSNIELFFLNEGANFIIKEGDLPYLLVDGKYYDTYGEYLIITDLDGNNMYILGANLDDIVVGGNYENKITEDASVNQDSLVEASTEADNNGSEEDFDNLFNLDLTSTESQEQNNVEEEAIEILNSSFEESNSFDNVIESNDFDSIQDDNIMAELNIEESLVEESELNSYKLAIEEEEDPILDFSDSLNKDTNNTGGIF